MKIRITESDIAKMVMEVTKRVLKENMDIRSLTSNASVFKVMDAYEIALGGNKEELMNSQDMFALIQQAYDSATPVEQETFVKIVNGGDIEIPDEFNEDDVNFLGESKLLKEGNDTLEAAKNWSNEVNAWNKQLMALKQKIWSQNGGQNTPELDLAFQAMRLLSTADIWFVNPYCRMLMGQ